MRHIALSRMGKLQLTINPFTRQLYSHPPYRAKRMAACCAESNNGNATFNFKPDCYLWCNVVLETGFPDPVARALNKFSNCLQRNQDPRYTPSMLCSDPALNGPIESQTSTQPAMPSSTSSGAEPRKFGIGKGVVLGLLTVGLILQAGC
ncbi:unnamed protein product [Cercospora beticola]|nr:unnamed protein product [Cercospora beticola]